MERSSRDLDKFVNDIPHEIVIPLTIPRSLSISLITIITDCSRYLWDGDRNCYLTGLKLKYYSDPISSSDSQAFTERSYPVLPSSTSLSLMASSSYSANVGQATSTLNPSSTPTTLGTETILPSDQSLENGFQSRQRRPSLARFAPTTPSSDDLSSNECMFTVLFIQVPHSFLLDTARQLAALDLAHHRFSKRT
jgi:hypothetical protein